MAIKAIEENSGRNGTTISVITQYVENNYELPENYETYLRRALEKGLETDVLKKVSKMAFAVNPKRKTAEKKTKTKTKTNSSKKTKRKTRRTSSKAS